MAIKSRGGFSFAIRGLSFLSFFSLNKPIIIPIDIHACVKLSATMLATVDSKQMEQVGSSIAEGCVWRNEIDHYGLSDIETRLLESLIADEREPGRSIEREIDCCCYYWVETIIKYDTYLEFPRNSFRPINSPLAPTQVLPRSNANLWMLSQRQ